ncbi:hypothetical protein DITRI_Ditri17bG0115000 [Diplodiscus trichospermus]
MTIKVVPSDSDPRGVGHAFMNRFYDVLHREPTQAYNFYQDLSVLSRPGPDGVMKTVTGVKDINELILSLDYQSYKAEICFVDAQFSYAKGLIVLVSGCLIGKNNLRRKFMQSLFLAPQKTGYYVLNDVFRYADDKEPASTQAALSPELELTHVPKNAVPNHTTAPSDNGDNCGNEVSHPLDNGKVSVLENGKVSALENEVVAEQLVPSSEKNQNDPRLVSQTASPVIQDDAPKKSYASIVQDLTKNSAPFRAPPLKTKPVEQPYAAAAAEAPAPKKSKNTSIFVANLPMNATEEMLSEVFKKFGPIKPNGIRVRSSKESNNCFGFVEFENAVSLQTAVKASPITIGNRQANIEEKRGGNNGGRPGRGGYKDENGYRNDNFKGQGNFNGGYRGENGHRNDNPRSHGNFIVGHNFGRNGRNTAVNEDTNKNQNVEKEGKLAKMRERGRK